MNAPWKRTSLLSLLPLLIAAALALPAAAQQYPAQQYPGQPNPGQQAPPQQYPGQQYAPMNAAPMNMAPIVAQVNNPTNNGPAANGPANSGPANTGRPLDERPATAPFELTPEQADYLDRVLEAWEAHTSKISTFSCKFTRWDYIPGFVPGEANKDRPALENDGLLKYSAPDKGNFEIVKIKRFNAKTNEYEPDPDEVGEHWVCNGTAVWEYNAKQKQVIERTIPPEMRGKAISDGPLPFLFGAEAKKLKARYFLRIITPQEFAETEIWVDAFPKSRADAANFKRSILRLKRDNFEPFALRVYDPGDRYSSYEFQDVKVNSPLDKLRDTFMPPRVPFGWKKIREDNGAGGPALPAPPAAAQRPQMLR
ncbi:MAG: TIGR03009 domain-containing protein [Planctomycetia bacterium]|nr:TIGR03009 domain-containing protein [Planctomycetia bacterium]